MDGPQERGGYDEAATGAGHCTATPPLRTSGGRFMPLDSVSPRRRFARLALVAIAVMLPLAVGCDGLVKSAMLDPPNQGDTFEGAVNVVQAGAQFWDIDRELHVPVGPPNATLRVLIKEPRPDDAEPDAAPPQPRGTVLVVHGWRAESIWIGHIGDALAQAGYRAVHVDLRGHGGSTGDAITYGVYESRDLIQVLDALHEHDLLQGPLGVWGVSMGGATAIQFAAKDSRVDAVVAVAPYTSMREVAPLVARRLLPILHLASDETLDRLVTEGAAAKGFDPDKADTLSAIQQLEAPVLIIHGKGDAIVPVEHGRRLFEAANGPCELVELDWAGHILAHFSSDTTDYSLDFFNRTLTAAAAASTLDE